MGYENEENLEGSSRGRLTMNFVWLVSYPRSGSTWLRWMLATIQHPEADLTQNAVLKELVPDTHLETRDFYLQKKYDWAPVFLKSHFCIDPEYSCRKVVYLYRDGRDVLLSFYNYIQNRDSVELDFTEFFDWFLNGNSKLLFGTWADHVRMWLSSMFNVNTLFVKYEDLIQNPQVILRKICNFSGVDANSDLINLAVENCAFSKMKEKSGEPLMIGKAGTSGGWRKNLSEEQRLQFSTRCKAALELAGYDMKGEV